MTSGIEQRLRAVASAALPPGVKRRLKRVARSCHRMLFAFTSEELKTALEQLGVAPGDVLMVHSSFDRFLGFQGGPLDVIRTLQEVVGAGGTLIMPTIPFRGTAVEYARSDPLFDARQTPSRMGLITELFRRSPGVLRSIHPTHSVAAWGSRAEALVAGHERSETPCGRLTPYGKLLEYDGKIVLAGVPPNTMTFGYFAAEDVEPGLVLTRDAYPMRWRDRDGTVRVSHLRLFSLHLDHDVSPLAAELRRRRQWRERRVGRLRLTLVGARDVYDATAALASSGIFPRNRSPR